MFEPSLYPRLAMRAGRVRTDGGASPRRPPARHCRIRNKNAGGRVHLRALPRPHPTSVRQKNTGSWYAPKTSSIA